MTIWITAILILLIKIVYTTCSVLSWWYTPIVAQENDFSFPIPDGVERMIQKAGPLYQYKINIEGELHINRNDGVWRRLRY